MVCQASGGGSLVALAGTIISIVPVLLANRMIIKFHALNDMVTATVPVGWTASGENKLRLVAG